MIRLNHPQENHKRGDLLTGAALVALFILVSAPLSASAQGARLIHFPPGSAVLGVPLSIQATVEGSAILPTEAKVYYRRAESDAFQFAELKVERYSLSGEIPGNAIVGGEVVYYLSAELTGGATLQLPFGAPVAGELFRVPIRSLETRSEESSAVIVLSPEPGSRLSEDQTVIAVSILQSVEKIDPTTLKIFFDGKDFSSSAKITEDLIVLALPSVRPGAHTVSIVRIKDGKEHKLLGWSFEGKISKQLRPEPGPIQVNVTTGVSAETFSNTDRRTAFLDGRVNGTYGKMKWGGRAYVTSRESKYLQPQNRFLGSIEYGGLALKVGDTQPRFSEFTLWGVRTRGVELNYYGSAFNLDVAQGELVRSIEGSSRLDTIIVVDNSTGDTLRSQIDPSQDSIRVENIVDQAGRYRRTILDVRPGFPISDNVKLSFNILKAKDNISSIDWGITPKDNVVLGADLEIRTKSRRFILATETALSMYNSDISEGAMDDAKSVEQYIVVNQFFEPLPTDTSILDGNIPQMELATKLLDELIKSSLAHRTSLSLNYLHNEMKIGYKTIGRSFKSLGSPTILTDVAGFSVEDRIRMLNSRLYLTLGYEGYSDNVNKRSPNTTDRNIIRAGLSIYSPPSYPNVNLGIRLYNRENDGRRVENRLPSGDTLIVDTRVNNSQAQYSVSLDQSFKWLNYEHLANVAWNSAITDDKINPVSALDLNTISLNLLSKRQPWEWRGSVSSTSQSSQNGASLINYTSINAGSRYTLRPSQIYLNAGIGTTMASGEVKNMTPQPPVGYDSPKRQEIGFSRLEFNAGAEYQITALHLVTLSFYKAIHSEDGYVEYWSGAKHYNADSPSYVKQNDMSVRLVYTFKM